MEGWRTACGAGVGRWVALLAVALGAVPLGGCGATRAGDGDVRETGPTARELRALATAHAPLVALHPREPWLPIAADDFIARSRLRWRSDDCGDATLAVGGQVPGRRGGRPVLRAARLSGSGSARPYRYAARRQATRCSPGTWFTSDDYTRPYDPLRHNDIAIAEGFYLDLADAARRGRPVRRRGPRAIVDDVPVYFEHRAFGGRSRSLRIAYWMLLPMSERVGPARWTGLYAHEGDWLRVTVTLRPVAGRLTPVALRYHGLDGSHADVPWRRSHPRAGHPLVLVARGGHKLYASPGRRRETLSDAAGRELTVHDDVQACPRCIAWRTWSRVLPARSQPWWGFGGAWGDSPAPSVAIGALGPSRWTDVRPFQLK